MKTGIKNEFDPDDTKQSSGFRAGRSDVDNIFSINQVNEKNAAINDLTKAYDTVPRSNII